MNVKPVRESLALAVVGFALCLIMPLFFFTLFVCLLIKDKLLYRYTLTGEFPHKGWYTWVSRINHPLLINAGLLAAFFIYPFRDKNTWMLRTIVLVFTTGTLAWGVVFEYRIWFELIPILLYPLYRGQVAQRESPPGLT